MNASQHVPQAILALQTRMFAGDSLDELIESHKKLLAHYKETGYEWAWLLTSDSLMMMYTTHPACLPIHYQQALPYVQEHHRLLNPNYHKQFWVNSCGYLGYLTFKLAQTQAEVSRAYDL